MRYICSNRLLTTYLLVEIKISSQHSKFEAMLHIAISRKFGIKLCDMQEQKFNRILHGGGAKTSPLFFFVINLFRKKILL